MTEFKVGDKLICNSSQRVVTVVTKEEWCKVHRTNQTMNHFTYIKWDSNVVAYGINVYNDFRLLTPLEKAML
jgi:hypothetical protein